MNPLAKVRGRKEKGERRRRERDITPSWCHLQCVALLPQASLYTCIPRFCQRLSFRFFPSIHTHSDPSSTPLSTLYSTTVFSVLSYCPLSPSLSGRPGVRRRDYFPSPHCHQRLHETDRGTKVFLTPPTFHCI